MQDILNRPRKLCMRAILSLIDKCFFYVSTEQAAGVYHRESRKGRYQLTFKEAKAVCKYEGGNLATYEQLEAARQIGLYPLRLAGCLECLWHKQSALITWVLPVETIGSKPDNPSVCQRLRVK